MNKAHYLNQCRGKMKWSNLLSAKRAANRMYLDWGETFDVYKCFYCRRFHVGHRKVND